jgi:hypothetical protein
MTSDNSPSRSLVIADAGNLPAMLGPELDQAAGYARAEKSAATRRAYRSDFQLFRAWSGAKQVTSLPAQPETVAAFLAAEANRRARTRGRPRGTNAPAASCAPYSRGSRRHEQ